MDRNKKEIAARPGFKPVAASGRFIVAPHAASIEVRPLNLRRKADMIHADDPRTPFTAEIDTIWVDEAPAAFAARPRSFPANPSMPRLRQPGSSSQRY